MNIKELAVAFGVFILIFYSAISFVQMFNYSFALPGEIVSAWEASKNQMENARTEITKSVERIQSHNPLEVMQGVFSLAFNGIFYIIISLYSVFISIPQAVWSGMNYLAQTFGVSSSIIGMIISILTIIIIIKTIEFITGRYFT